MFRYVFLLFIIGFFFISCGPQEKPITPHFAVCLFNKDENPTSLLLLESLDKPSSQSIQIPLPTSRIGEREYIQKNGFFYRLLTESRVFKKFQIQGAKMVLIDSVQLKNVEFETYTWKDEDHLLAVSRNDNPENKSQALIYQINVKDMRIVKEDTITLPFASGDYRSLHIGLIDFENDKLWLAYSFFKSIGRYSYTISDTTYYATINYPEFKLDHVEKETRSTYPGGYNLVQSYSFHDEQGDYYFITNPGIALGNNISKPTAIFRKQKGQEHVDPTYMINISDSIGEHAYGLWYAGDGKAIIRNEQKALYTDFSNHHSAYQFEYRLVDLGSGKIEKIPFPLDKGTQKDNIYVDKSNIYVAIDDSNNQHFIWKYNLQTKEISKGVQLPNSANYTVRLDFLK